MNYRVVDTVWDSSIKQHVCKYCNSVTRAHYIITGHDHTDESLDTCNCGKGTSIEEAYENNRYSVKNYNVEYDD
jgi:hypothetical protein